MSLEQVEIKRSINNKLAQFFFAKSDGTAEALFRIGYAVVLFVDLLGQYGKWELLYSNQGLSVGTRFDAFYTPNVVNGLYFFWIGVLLLLAAGVATRWTAILNYALLYYFFMLRGVFVGHGADWVYHSMGFSLMFMTTDRYYSLCKSWFPRWSKPRWSKPRWSKPRWGDTDWIWPLRLAQINFLFIYFSAGVAKLFDPVWLDGSALELTFAHPFLTYSSASWMGSSTQLLAALTYFTTVWQLVFPLALFSRHLRVFFVLTALIFHLMIALSMRVGWFSEIMIVSTLLFWDDFAFYFQHKREPEDSAEKTPESIRPRTRNFLIVYLMLFAGTQIYFLSLAAGSPIKLLKMPAEWAAKITGNRPYDLVPSKYIRRVQFVVFEVVDREGNKGFLYPFKRNGELNFGLADVKEIRRGLARVRLAAGRASPVIWTNFINQDIVPQVQAGEWQYPLQINIYRIDIPIADVQRPFNIGEVPKQLLSRVALPQRNSQVQLPPAPGRRLQSQP